MGTNYEHLTAEERATLMVMRADGCSQRAVARCLGRSPSTISRELARNASCCKPVGDTIAVIPYDASLAGKRALVLRQEPRKCRISTGSHMRTRAATAEQQLNSGMIRRTIRIPRV